MKTYINKMWNKVALTAAVVLLSLQAQAAILSVTPFTNAITFTNVISEATRIKSISIQVPLQGANMNYRLLDAPAVDVDEGFYAAGRSNGSLATFTSYLTNISKVFTSYSGVLFTNVQSNALYTYATTIGGTTNAWGTITQGTVGSNSTVTITFPGTGFQTVYGLALTNGAVSGQAPTFVIEHYPNL